MKGFPYHLDFYYLHGDAVYVTQNGRLYRCKEKYYGHTIAEIWKSENFELIFLCILEMGHIFESLEAKV